MKKKHYRVSHPGSVGQIFTKAAQAQLRERANDYKEVRWHWITRLSQPGWLGMSGGVGRSRDRPPPAAHEIPFCHIPDPLASWPACQVHGPHRGARPSDWLAHRIGPPVRCLGPALPDLLDPHVGPICQVSWCDLPVSLWDPPARSICW
jgi:hypothetical protein